MPYQPTIERDGSGRITKIVMLRPSDLHAHFRYERLMDAVAPEIMRHVKYALVMPNGGPGKGGIIRTMNDALDVYVKLHMIRGQCQISTFTQFVMTLYHTTDVTPRVIEEIATSGVVHAIKNYPSHGGTTNSGHGVPFDECDVDVIRAMIEHRVPLLIHAEDVIGKDGRELPHPLREAHCITHRLWQFRDKYPDLRMCVEHISTKEAVAFVKADTSGNTASTETPQHILLTNKYFTRSWGNHLKCMPIVKTEEDRCEVSDFTTSGDPRAIAGSDIAAHVSAAKNKPFDECACGCWTPHAIALYALAFMRAGALDDRFVKFMSLNGPAWWGLEPPAEDDLLTIRAETERDIPDPLPVPALNDVVIPLGWAEASTNDRLRVGFVAC